MGLALRRQLASYVLAFDSNPLPIVGQQATLTTANAGPAAPRIALLEAQPAAGSCDLVARAQLGGRDTGFVLQDGSFVLDSMSRPPLSDAALRGLAGTELEAMTFTCVPPGSGWRMGIDRDGDGYADGDEIAAGSDPADARSTP